MPPVTSVGRGCPRVAAAAQPGPLARRPCACPSAPVAALKGLRAARPMFEGNAVHTAPALSRAQRGCRFLCRDAKTSVFADVDSSKAVQPDLVLEVAGTSAKVHVFGIDHRNCHPHVGEYILRTRPDAVVVETSVTHEHGAVPGNGLSCSDELVQGPEAFFVRMFCQLAAQLNEQGPDPAKSEFWHQIKDYYRGEQLAYIAAFATGAKLIFGDRPKDISYRRLLALASAEQLDEGFGLQCQLHYQQMLGQMPTSCDAGSMPMAEVIMMQERDAVMCKVVDDACRRGLPQGGLSKPAENVVLVVGRSHLEGLKFLWADNEWQRMVQTDDLATSPLMSSDAPERQETGRQAGVRRGLMHAMMTMMVTAEVLQDMGQVLGPVPDGQFEAVDAIEEIYGCNRMMLATLPRELLSQVCSGLNCDMYEVLEPFRKLRAVNGGPVFTEEIIMTLRALNFEFE